MNFVKHFDCPCGELICFCSWALTLPASAVTDIELEPGDDVDRDVYTRIHGSGWKITASIHTDWYFWVNYFVANHPELGWIRGDFEYKITASSEKAFNHFFQNHPPERWDYGDI